MRVLLVEDDVLLGQGLRTGVQSAGHTVDWLEDGGAADAALRTTTFDVVILDLSLPGLDGSDVLARYRARGGDTPVLVLTARDAVTDRVQGLDAGADDYIAKPVDLDELLARLRALVRRGAGHASPVLAAAGVELDPGAHTVRVDNQEVALTRFEFTLLELLVRQAGRVLARRRLQDALYGWDDAAAEGNSLDVHVHRLRQKVGRHRITTVRGIGYKLSTD